VHTCRVAMLRGRCARAHLWCRNAARSVRTCTPAVSQCCAVGAHVHTCRVATLRGRRARAHLRCRNAARWARTCARRWRQCYICACSRCASWHRGSACLSSSLQLRGSQGSRCWRLSSVWACWIAQSSCTGAGV